MAASARAVELLRGLLRRARDLSRPERRADLVRVLACVVLGGIAGYLLVPTHSASPRGKGARAWKAKGKAKPTNTEDDPGVD